MIDWLAGLFYRIRCWMGAEARTSRLLAALLFMSVVQVGLLAALLATACGDDGNGQTAVLPTATATETTPNIDGETFGGPYEIVYDKIKGKQDDFTLYNKNGGLAFSKAAELDEDLFVASIGRNKESSLYGEIGQLYNYAVTEDGIIVAVWTETDLIAMGRERCPGGRNVMPDLPNDLKDNETMVNWFPEEPSLVRTVKLEDQKPPPPASQSYCWLKKGAGVLDAISKHFMLAQGEGMTVNQYEGEWVKKDVIYAGEITVDVELCTYSVNQLSGTYQPENNKQIRDALITYFSEELDATPSSVNNRPVNVEREEELKIRGGC